MCMCAMFVRVCKHWGLMGAKHKGHTVIIYSTPPTKQLKKRKEKKASLHSQTPFQHILPAPDVCLCYCHEGEKNRNPKISK